MPEPSSLSPEERLLSDLNDKQLELVLFYLVSSAEGGLSVEALARELSQKMKGANYQPSGFHITHQLLSLADCMKQHSRDELAQRLTELAGQLPGLLS